MIIPTVIFSFLAAIAYRLGGMSSASAGFKVDTKIRDCGVPTLAVIWMIMYGGGYPWWAHFFAWGAMFGALTTYWDWMFGDEDNFYMHGLIIGLAFFPYAIAEGIWIQLIVRAVALGLFMGGLNWLVHKFHIPFSDWIEELGRGFACIISLLVLYQPVLPGVVI